MNIQSRAIQAEVDPIEAEIIRFGLLAIPKQIEVNITRTAYSPLVYEYKDYAVGIVDADARLVADSQGGIPLFVANALGVAVRDGLLVHGRDGIAPGDVIISNHAGTLGQHLNNVVMYTPIHAHGELVGFMAVLVHWVDIGGITMGSCAPTGTSEIYQEGVQFRSVKLMAAGKRVDDMYRMIEFNTRFPVMLMGDLESQLAGCLLGRDLAIALFEKHGVPKMRAAIEAMWARSEKIARAAVAAMPDGEYRASSFLDNDGLEIDRNVPIEVVVRVSGEEMTVDFSGVADQLRGSINSGREGGAVTAARIAFKYLATPHEPADEGAFRPLKVEIPEGKFLSARAEAPMAMYSTPLPSVIDTVMRAMVKAAPDRLAAGHHSNFGIHSIVGTNRRTGERFFNLTSGQGGWGASQGFDGPGPYKTMSHGDTYDVPVEVQEALYPMRVEHFALRPDSGGAGEFRGGLGTEKDVLILDDCELQLNFERTRCPPWGVFGGADAGPPSATIDVPGSPPRRILKGNLAVKAGDRLHVSMSGGGGFGNPFDRDPAAVLRDVELGYVTQQAAREQYGVVITNEKALDTGATELLRRGKG
jgi:N-methylhydantoinase B